MYTIIALLGKNTYFGQICVHIGEENMAVVLFDVSTSRFFAEHLIHELINQASVS